MLIWLTAKLKTITVGNGGQDYVATPNVEITDTSGKGKGAFAIAQVTNNQVTGIIVLNGGTDYTDKSTIRVRIVSKGSGVFATANVTNGHLIGYLRPNMLLTQMVILY